MGMKPGVTVIWALKDWIRGRVQTLRGRGRDPHALERTDARTVLILPGVWEPWHVTWKWGHALYDEGFDVRFAPEFGLMVGSIPELAAELLALIDANRWDEPILVAHSKGGLVAKQAMMDEPTAIEALVACGSPFEGSPVARMTPSILQVRNLSPDSPEVRVLSEAPTDVDRRIVTVEAEWDQNVPTVGMRRGGFHCLVPTRGHNHLLDDPIVARHIVRIVQHIDQRW